MPKVMKQFILGSIISLVASIGLGLINYLIRKVLSINLSLEVYGFFYAAYSFLMIFLTYLDLGLGQSASILQSQYIAGDKRQKAKHIFTIITAVKFTLGLILALILFLLSDFLMTYFFKFPEGSKIFRFFVLFIPVTSVASMIIINLNIFNKQLSRNILLLTQSVITLLVIYFGINHFGINIAFIIYVIAPLIIFFIGLYMFKRWHQWTFVKIPKDLFNVYLKEIFQFSKWVAISIIAFSTLTHIDTFMLTYLTSLKDVGLYNIAMPIMQIFNMFAALAFVITPMATKLWQQEAYIELAEIISSAVKFILILLCFSVIFMIDYSTSIISILFAEEFVAASNCLIILTASIFLSIICQFLVNTLQAIGEIKKVAVFAIIIIIVNIGLNTMLIPKWGINGAALATLSSNLILSLAVGFIASKKLRIKFRLTDFLTYILLGAILISVSLYKSYNSWDSTIINLGFYSTVVIIMGGAIYFCDRHSIKKVLKIFQSRNSN